MKRKTGVLFILLAIHLFLCSQSMQAGEQFFAPDFKLGDLKGEVISLNSHKDKKAVLLFFWTTWCPSCRTELKVLNNMYPELIKDGWEVLAIDIGEPNYKVDNFVKNYALNFIVLLDKDTAVAQAYNILGVPTYVLIDKQGLIRFKNNYFPQKDYKNLISE